MNKRGEGLGDIYYRDTGHLQATAWFFTVSRQVSHYAFLSVASLLRSHYTHIIFAITIIIREL